MIHFAKKVMGKIDREPANCEIANKKLISILTKKNTEQMKGDIKAGFQRAKNL